MAEPVTLRDILRLLGFSAEGPTSTLQRRLAEGGVLPTSVVKLRCRDTPLYDKDKALEAIKPYLAAMRANQASQPKGPRGPRKASEDAKPAPRIEKMDPPPQTFVRAEDYLKALMALAQNIQKDVKDLRVQVSRLIKATPGLMELMGNIKEAICSSPLEAEKNVMVAANTGLSLDTLIPV